MMPCLRLAASWTPANQVRWRSCSAVLAPTTRPLVTRPAADASQGGLVPAFSGELEAVWCTHHHWDHVDGAVPLAGAFPGLRVLAPRDSSPIPGATHTVGAGEGLDLAGREVGRILSGGGAHTQGHVMFLVGEGQGGVVLAGHTFSCLLLAGDVLFPQGAGRWFEGTAQDFYRAVWGMAKALPGDALLCTGHDYSAGNAAFAAAVGCPPPPREGALQDAPPSVTTWQEEVAGNPFLRFLDADVQGRVVQRLTGSSHGVVQAACEELGGVACPTSPAAYRATLESLTPRQTQAACVVLGALRALKNGEVG